MIERDSNNRPSKPPDFLEVDKDSDNQLLSEKYKKEYSSSLVLNYFSVSYKVLMYLGIVVLASWLSYQQGKVDGRSEQNPATITSDNETTTIIPDDPGGLEIPNQNLTIYDSGEDLTESSTLNPEENQTMPEPDQPIMSVDPETDLSQSEINKIIEDLSDSKKNIQASEETQPATVVEKEISSQGEDFVANIAKDLKNEDLNEVGSYRVQLASLTSETVAENELSKMKDKFSNVLNDFELKIYPVNIEGKGMYYRIQAGPIKTSDEAKNLCNELIRLQKKCFVVNLGKVD
ncbi:MAG: SPOR domain-containing protein [Alphaproteobacteria bacterium]|nr:SPOR domain-containing protein [Alphaproteobacteria bacterium]